MPQDRSTERSKKNEGKLSGKKKDKWHGKRMHEQQPRNLDEKLVDYEQSYRWLKSGDIKGETESTIVAAQYQTISTNYFKNTILEEEPESKCRLCKQHEETIDHLTSGCLILLRNEYLIRHDKVCTHLHHSLCKAVGIETTDKWYTQTCPSQCMTRRMSHCCGIKQYTQTEKLQKRSQI
jgi:hypothetical protein